MRYDRENPEFRMLINAVLQPLFEKNPRHGIYSGKQSLIEFGIPEDEAAELVAEYHLIYDIHSKPGNIHTIPEYDPEIPPSEEQQQDTVLQGMVWFTLGYIEDTTEASDKSMSFMGEYWLGNSAEDTKKLVSHLQEDPNRTVGFLNWAFGRDERLQSLFDEYRTRSANNTLRPPSFE